jgi:hypothetical protein
MLPSLKKRGVLCSDHLYPGVFPLFSPRGISWWLHFVLDHLIAALELHSDYVFIAVHMTYPVPQI